ncbi:hypothetical protein FIM07_03670 [SAR202 cluster bacterium AD-802-F09_MRT_200m]|nr:hypothetical protein [SAR202 cluster bacterium AD-802-F09_MRT_200m]
MLTLFTIPKAFQGHIGVIQRNAIKSWTLLQPKCQVILLADDEGTAEAAEELGVRHIPDIPRNEFGTPLLNSAFQRAEDEADFPVLCHVNADIILMSDFIEAVHRVKEKCSSFLMTARRRDLDVKSLLEFEEGWEGKLLSDVAENGRLQVPTGIDFWVYTKALLKGMPPLAVGRIATESWLLYKTRIMRADLVDSTRTVISVHQNHDYSHHPNGQAGIGTGVEAQRNRELVGGKPYFFTIRDRTHILTGKGLRRSRDGWRLWRGLRTALVLHPSMPRFFKLAFKVLNGPIDGSRDFLIMARNTIKSGAGR